MQVEADHRPVRRLRSIEIAAFPRRRSRSGTASTTPATCASSRATSRRPETSAASTVSTAVRAAFFRTRFTPWSEGARDLLSREAHQSLQTAMVVSSKHLYEECLMREPWHTYRIP